MPADNQDPRKAKDITPPLINSPDAKKLPMTQEMAVTMGKTQMQKILGPKHQEACVIQHGKDAFRPGEPAEIIDYSHYNPRAAKAAPPTPCWVLRYADGTGPIYVDMTLPCYAIDKAPGFLGIGAPRLWLEMVPNILVRKALKVKGRD